MTLSLRLIILFVSFHGLRGWAEYPVQLLKNVTETLYNEMNTSSVVIDVDPFDFVYENAAILWIKQYFYYQDIQLASINSTESTDVVKYVFETKSLEFDWVGKNIYWLQSNIIEVSDLNGKYRKALYWKNIDKPTTMVLDSWTAYLFWLDEGQFPKMERAGMHGDESSRFITIQDRIQKPFGLTIDIYESNLYWNDASLQIIERCDYKGDNRVIMAQLHLQTPGALAFFNGTLYWIDQANQTVNALSVSSKATVVIAELPTRLLSRRLKLGHYPAYRPLLYENFRMRFFDAELLYAQHLNKSMHNYEVCDHLRLITSSFPHYICMCSANFHMTTDGCMEDIDTDFPDIFLTSSSGIMECRNSTTDVKYENALDDIAFLNLEGDIVFSERNNIFQSSLSNVSAFKSVIPARFGYIWFMEFDWIGQNMYVLHTYLKYGTISVLRLGNETEFMETYLFGKEKLRMIKFAIDPSKALMFLAQDRTVLRCSMDGDKRTRKIIMTLKGQRTHIVLALDVQNEVVYWSYHVAYVKSQGNTILRFTYDGDVLPYYSNRIFTLEIILHGDYIITAEFFETRTVLINRCKKDFGGDCKIICDKDLNIRRMKLYTEIRNSTGIHPCEENNGNCSDFCLLTTLVPYYRCDCQINYVLSKDAKTCILPPCAIDNGKCSMTCEELDRLKYKCSCIGGFLLSNDNKTCHGDMGLTVVQSIGRGWRQVDTSSSPYVTLDTWLGISVDAASYDPVDSKLYWTSISMNVIRQSNLDGSDVTDVVNIVHDNNRKITLAFDWLSREILWLIHFKIWQFRLTDSEANYHEINKYIPDPKLYYFEERTEIDTIGTNGMTLDVFSGYVFVLWYGKTMVIETTEIIYNCEIFSFQRSFLFHAEDVWKRRAFSFDSTGSPGYIGLDGFRNKIYIARNNNLTIFNTDGTGENTTSTVLYKHMVNHIVVLDETENKDCMDHEKCWGINSRWNCLVSRQICDGVIDCYDAHDEYYCSLCNIDHCRVVSLIFRCLSYDKSNPETDKNDKSRFLNWTLHPISKIISFENILSYDCTLKFEMQSDKPNHIKSFGIHSLYHFHRLRQMVLSDTFINLANVTSVRLMGNPLLVDVDPVGIGIFFNVKDLSIEDTNLPTLPSATFNMTSALKRLNIFRNAYLNRIEEHCFEGLHKLEALIISGSNIPFFHSSLFRDLENLKFLNLSNNNIYILDVGLLNHLRDLVVIDLKGNDIKLTSQLFLYTLNLEVIYCDSFTICCIKPESVKDSNCTAKKDDISSCSNLVENRFLAAFLWIFAILAFVGNLSVLIYRGCVDKTIFSKSYFIFVYNLGIADLIMAVYMLIIAWHDADYDGIYVWNDYNWKRSILCEVSGILSMVSCEASMMFVCMVTMERFFSIKFAFGNIRISRKIAGYVSLAIWIFASLLAVIPTVFYNDFFSRSGVCIAIPLTQDNDTGIEYSTVIFLGLNFLFCVLILIGQIVIFDEVRKASKRIQSTQHGRNLAVAKRLAAVVITDCLCWIPVGILDVSFYLIVMMSLGGIKTPREIYAWVIIFILPVNAAVNPYLYTLTDIDRKKIRKCIGIKH